MWFGCDVIGQFSINVVTISLNVLLRDLLFSLNMVSKPRMLSVSADYVLGSLATVFCLIDRYKPMAGPQF